MNPTIDTGEDLDLAAELVYEDPGFGAVYYVSAGNGRSFEVLLEYRDHGARHAVYGWIGSQEYNPPGGEHWADPEAALHEILREIRRRCQSTGA